MIRSVPNRSTDAARGPRGCFFMGDGAGQERVTSGKFAFPKRESLFGKLRAYFHKVGVAPVAGICATGMAVAVPQDRIGESFVLAAASLNEFVNCTDCSSTGTKMPRTSWKTMAQYPLCLSQSRWPRLVCE